MECNLIVEGLGTRVGCNVPILSVVCPSGGQGADTLSTHASLRRGSCTEVLHFEIDYFSLHVFFATYYLLGNQSISIHNDDVHVLSRSSFTKNVNLQRLEGWSDGLRAV